MPRSHMGGSIMKPILRRLIIVTIYLIFAVAWWTIARNLIPTPLGVFTRDAILFSICFSGLVILLRMPSFKAKHFDEACKVAGIHNENNERPRLLRVSRNEKRLHGYIWEIDNKGVTISKLWKEELAVILNVRIDNISYHPKNTTRTYIFVTPRKYAQPLVIHPDNTALCERLSKLPNLLCVGKTGSGKSFSLRVILGCLTLFTPNCKVIIGDFKNSSFPQFKALPNYFGYHRVIEAIKMVYQEFMERLEADDKARNRNIWYFLIDEYSAMLSSLDRKTADEIKGMVGELLQMGRSLGIRLLIGLQRADSEYFKAGARDQFWGILALGDISKEQKQMLFSEYKDKMNEPCSVGEGYLYISGQGIERIRVANLRDTEQINASIQKAMSR